MAKADDYRRAIEHATIHAELAPFDEIKKLWLHIRENYEYLLLLDKRMSASSLPNSGLI